MSLARGTCWAVSNECPSYLPTGAPLGSDRPSATRIRPGRITATDTNGRSARRLGTMATPQGGPTSQAGSTLARPIFRCRPFEEPSMRFSQDDLGARVVRNVGRGQGDHQQPAIRVDGDVSLASDNLLARVRSARFCRWRRARLAVDNRGARGPPALGVRGPAFVQGRGMSETGACEPVLGIRHRISGEPRARRLAGRLQSRQAALETWWEPPAEIAGQRGWGDTPNHVGISSAAYHEGAGIYLRLVTIRGAGHACRHDHGDCQIVLWYGETAFDRFLLYCHRRMLSK